VACAHRLDDIVVVCAHQQGDLGPTAGNIIQGLCASDVAWVHQESDVGQWQAASAKACTNMSWRVRIGWATLASANGRQH